MNFIIKATTTKKCNPRSYLSKLSISSTKMIVGASLYAREKSARTLCCDSPNHLLINVDTCKLIKVAPLSLAIALAIIVFPVPGTPLSAMGEIITLF